MWEGKNQHLIAWWNFQVSGLQTLDLLSINLGKSYLWARKPALRRVEGWKKIITSSQSVFFQSRTFFFFCEERHMNMYVLLIVSSSLFSRKKILFLLLSLYAIGGFSAYLLLLEESAGVAVSWSPIFSRVWRRGCHCFSIEWCCLLTETQYNIFPNCSHCFCVPASEHQVLYLAALIVKIKLQLPRLYAKKGTAKGLLSYFHFVVRTVKRGRGSAVGTVLEQQDLWEAVTQTAYKD